MDKTKTGFRDTIIMSKRSLTLSMRNVDTLLTSLMSPILMLILFTIVFGGAMDVGDTSYINYVFPGVILQCVGQCAATTAVSVSSDIKVGIIDRFFTMPIRKTAVLTGHVLEALFRNLLTIIALVILGLIIGFRPAGSIPEWLLALGITLLFVLAISWSSVLLGLLARSPEGASGFTILGIVLPYISSGFAPIETMPKWIHFIAKNQPMTPIIETLRALLLGKPLESDDLMKSILWCVGMIVVFYLLSRRVFAKKMTK